MYLFLKRYLERLPGALREKQLADWRNRSPLHLLAALAPRDCAYPMARVTLNFARSVQRLGIFPPWLRQSVRTKRQSVRATCAPVG